MTTVVVAIRYCSSLRHELTTVQLYLGGNSPGTANTDGSGARKSQGRLDDEKSWDVRLLGKYQFFGSMANRCCLLQKIAENSDSF